jgi:hypothetical protein
MHHNHRDSRAAVHVDPSIYMGFKLNLFASFLYAYVIQLFVKLSYRPSSEFRLFVALEEFCVWLIVKTIFALFRIPQRISDLKLKVLETEKKKFG